MQRGAGATLSRALCQYGLDLNADAFEEIRPPSLVTTATLTATGQLPKFADDAYSIERDDLWCIPTAEVPLTSIYANEVLDEPQLPIRVMAYSSSFRREAGSAGRDTRGMLRAHEFDKVEILSFATPEQAPDLLDDMTARAERAIAGLGLPYRIIEICTGDMGQSHHRSFDIEVYAPGADTWLEVSSVSWFSDYQARRGNIRFRRHDADGKPRKGTEFVHTLNGSALAVPRVWAAIIENYRNADGSVDVPEVLWPYMRGIRRIEPVALNARGDRTDDAGPSPGRPTVLRDRRVQYETAGLDVADLDIRSGRAVEALARRSLRSGRGRTERDDGGDDRCRRRARRPHRAGAWRRRSRVSCSSPTTRARRAVSSTRHRSRRRCSPGSTCTARFVSGPGSSVSSAAESDAYFASRPRASQIGAWASPQSDIIADRSFLDDRVARFEEQFADRRRPAPGELGRLATDAVRMGVLAGPPEPPARPSPLPPARHRCRRRCRVPAGTSTASPRSARLPEIGPEPSLSDGSGPNLGIRAGWAARWRRLRRGRRSARSCAG